MEYWFFDHSGPNEPNPIGPLYATKDEGLVYEASNTEAEARNKIRTLFYCKIFWAFTSGPLWTATPPPSPPHLWVLATHALAHLPVARAPESDKRQGFPSSGILVLWSSSIGCIKFFVGLLVMILLIPAPWGLEDNTRNRADDEENITTASGLTQKFPQIKRTPTPNSRGSTLNN